MHILIPDTALNRFPAEERQEEDRMQQKRDRMRTGATQERQEEHRM